MRTQSYNLGDEVLIRFVETHEDAEAFLEWHAEQGIIALDTETTGLDIFSPTFAMRTVQFGSTREAWVLPRFFDVAALALQNKKYILHNAGFDSLVLNVSGLIELDFMHRVEDTYILAHLNDPRPRKEGGVGLKLKELGNRFVSELADDGQKQLYAEFHKIGKNKDTGWAAIDVENPVYWLYAGLDTIITARLYPELKAIVAQQGNQRLAQREHDILRTATRLRKKGVRVDVEYTEKLRDKLAEDELRYAELARQFGVDNVNSTTQIISALEGSGEVLTKRTEKGNISVDSKVLLPMADMNDKFEELGAREPNPLARAVIMSKRAGKWRSAYAENFLKFRDSNDFLHPSINQLQARTARMSITDPALQTLPSKDWMIRRAILADEGCEVVAADYKAMELRVLAAGAGVRGMLEAIRSGSDLHDFTASLIYGPDFSVAQRKAAKAVGLGKVFGGGANTLSLQTGIPVAEVSHAIKEYERVYPEVKEFSKRLTREAYRNGFKVITASGRQLPVDRNRTYAVVNYWVQSTSRDIMAAAMMRAEEAGIDIRLPVHDEMLAMAPLGQGQEVARELGRIMSTEFRGVRIDTDYAVYGKSWGHGYGAPN